MGSERLLDRARGALLGTFVGDALGMPFEGQHGRLIPARLEMLDARLGRGTYTDDTQMMIALAESLIRCEVVDEGDLARAFQAAYDPRRGYDAGTRRVIELWRQGVPVDEAAGRLFAGRGSLGNGAAMRVAPVAVRFFDDAVVLDVQARRSARVTHAHAVGVDAAAVAAAAIAAALRGDDPLAAGRARVGTEELRAPLERALQLAGSGRQPHDLAHALGCSSAAHESVPAAVCIAAYAEDFEAAVTDAIRLGGDTDTIGAMCGAIAGARFGAGSIPARWVEALERGERGREHVMSLADELARRAQDRAGRESRP